MSAQLVIGLGTGRCGTLSLAKLLDRQTDCEVRHERYPATKWYGDTSLIQKILADHEARDSPWGDVAFYYLPYINQIRQHVPGVRFICLKRDRQATVESFLRVHPRGCNWFGVRGKKHPWDLSFPDFGDVGIREGAGVYWDYYYETAEGLQGDDFRVYSTDVLNDPEITEEMLTFAGFENPRVQIGIHAHRGHR